MLYIYMLYVHMNCVWFDASLMLQILHGSFLTFERFEAGKQRTFNNFYKHERLVPAPVFWLSLCSLVFTCPCLNPHLENLVVKIIHQLTKINTNHHPPQFFVDFLIHWTPRTFPLRPAETRARRRNGRCTLTRRLPGHPPSLGLVASWPRRKGWDWPRNKGVTVYDIMVIYPLIMVIYPLIMVIYMDDMDYIWYIYIYTGWWLTYPSEKYESQLGWLFPIYGKIKNVPNHQPVCIYIYYVYCNVKIYW